MNLIKSEQTKLLSYLIKKEFKMLYKSPVLYAIILFFILGAGVFFIGGNSWFNAGYSDFRTFFLNIPFLFCIIIPMLTMNLWADEKKYFTDKLLFSFPISFRLIVVAKYLNLILVWLLILILSFAIPFSVFSLGNFDIGSFIVSYFSMFLFGAGILSLSLAISAVSKHSAINFLLSFLIISFFILITGFIYKNIKINILQSIVKYFSFSSHFESSARGLFDLRDLIFYIVLIAFGIELCVFILNYQNKKNKKSYKTEFLLFCSALFLLVLVTGKFYFRIDTTKQKTYSLSKSTIQMIENLDSTVKITWIKTDNVDSFFPSLKYLNDMLNEYKIQSNNKFLIEIKKSSDFSKEAINKLGIVSRQVEANALNSKTIMSLYSALLVEYKGETRIIPFIDDIDILEYDIARFIDDMNLISTGQQSRSIYLIAPPNSLETDYKYILPWLDYAGFSVDLINLPIDNIPNDKPLMVVGSDYIDFSSASAIDVFLKKNGNAIFFVSGNTIDYKGKWNAIPKTADFLIPVLGNYGFSINSNLVLDLINFRLEMSALDNSSAQFINYPFWIQILQSNIVANNPIFSGYKNLQTFWASSIEVDDKKNIVGIAKTSSKSIAMVDKYNTDPFGKQIELFSSFPSEERIIIAETKDKNRILVISDEYMISNAIDFTGSSYNMDFMVNCVEYLFDKDNLILLKNKQHTAQPFKKFEANKEFNKIVFRARLFNLIILPLCILGFGIYIFILKRKKQQ